MKFLPLQLEIITQPQKRGLLLDILYSDTEQCYILQHTALGTVTYQPSCDELRFQKPDARFNWEKRVLTMALRYLHTNVFSIKNMQGNKLVMYV